MKNIVLFLFGLSFTLFLNGCDQSDNKLKDEWCYTDVNDRQLFSSALGRKNVNYKYSESDGCYYTDFKDQDKVTNIQTTIFGKQPPVGLNISNGVQGNLKIVEKLNENGIKTKKAVYHGIEFIVWEEKDADKVQSILELLPEQLDHMNKMRQETKSDPNK